MSRLTANVGAALAIFRRDLLIYSSYRFVVLSPILTGIFTVTLFRFISRLANANQVGTADDYYAFVVIGVIIVSVLSSLLVAPPITLRQELVAGTFERLLLSPFGAARAAVSMMIFPLVLALLVSLVTLTFATLAYDLSLIWSTVPLAVPITLLTAVAFLPFGLLLLTVIVAFKQTNAGGTFVVAGVALVGGLYFPVTLLPSWAEWMAEVQPFTPAADLLRHVVVGTALRDPAWSDVLTLAGFVAVLLPLSVWALSRAIRRGRRRGTITEY